MQRDYEDVLYGQCQIDELGNPDPDFEQQANLGLMRAARTYDPAAAEFPVYARYWIRDFIQQYIRRAGVVRRPKGKKIKLLPDESLNVPVGDEGASLPRVVVC
jgi:hypothetical protein